MREGADLMVKMRSSLRKFILLVLLAFPVNVVFRGPPVAAEVVREDEDAVEMEEDVVDGVTADDEDDEAEVEDDERTELMGEKEEEEEEEEEEEVSVGEMKASPNADTTILFVKGEDFPANDIVKFLLGFTNKGSEDFVVDSLDASFRYPQDYQFHIQNFTALQLGTAVPPGRQATFEYSFIPAEPMGGRPFGLVINLNYKDGEGNVFQDAVFNQTVTVTEKEDGLDGETVFMYIFLSGLGLLLVVGLHQLLESRKRRRPAPKVEMGTSSHNNVDLSWIPQETLNQMNKASPRRSPRKRNHKRSAGSDE
ncbi:translocon-associated protein subunit alpha isoform X2 [Festucalex cinctus]